MHDALYFPIHRAKRGEITSVGHLKPSTLPLVRLSTPTEYVLWRAPRSDYVGLAELAVASKDFDLTLES
jgi:hypothetical protein